MIYPTFVAAAAALLLASAAQAIPAGYEYTSRVSMANWDDQTILLGDPSILPRSHDERPSRFAVNDSYTIHQNLNFRRNEQFPPIFYLPQRRDTASGISERRATDVNLLSNQNGIPPPHAPTTTSGVQNASVATPNTSVTFIPRPTPASHNRIHQMVSKGANASQKEKTHMMVAHRKEGKGRQS
jgi:hypothetical protein